MSVTPKQSTVITLKIYKTTDTPILKRPTRHTRALGICLHTCAIIINII